MSFANGENVGPYRIIEQLGQGGMATVYKAYHAALDRYVAIKALHPAIMEDEGFLKRFQREARVVARLDHPNIVPIYDYAEHGGRPYLVMKFIEGETLKACLARGSLSKEETLKVVDTVGKALSYAHERGILHRDIKPSNVLLSPDGSIYLADFGLARIAEVGASTLSGDMLMGTPHYISPEQARGERDLDRRTDLYSFGVVLYELVVGRVPFSSDTPFSIIHDHIYTPLPLPCKVNPNVSEVTERVLLKALAKDREDRFQSADELVAAFRAASVRDDLSVLINDAKPSVDTQPFIEQVVAVTEAPPIEPKQELHAVSAEPVAPQPVKKSRQWLWVAGGLTLTCLVLFIFLAAISQAREGPRLQLMNEPIERAPEIIAPRVDIDNSDPAVHFERAEELLAEGDTWEAYKELLKAGDLLLEAGKYREAVKAYIWAGEVSERPLLSQRMLIDPLSQALFLSAPEEELWPDMERLSEEYPEWRAVDVAMARAQLHSGHHDEALGMLEEVLADAPDDILAMAVLAEFRLVVGEVDEGLRIIEFLLAEQQPPDWLVYHLEMLMREH